MNQHGHTPCGIAFVASAALLAMSALQVEADGSSVAKIYHPYVQPLERELELRLVAEQGRANEDVWRWRLGYGQALSSSFFAELYVIGEAEGPDAGDVTAYELEGLWQLTEQGQYTTDWGLLFELEKEHREDAWEFSTALLAERAWGAWVGTANAHLTREWGADLRDEWDCRAAIASRRASNPPSNSTPPKTCSPWARQCWARNASASGASCTGRSGCSPAWTPTVQSCPHAVNWNTNSETWRPPAAVFSMPSYPDRMDLHPNRRGPRSPVNALPIQATLCRQGRRCVNARAPDLVARPRLLRPGLRAKGVAPRPQGRRTPDHRNPPRRHGERPMAELSRRPVPTPSDRLEYAANAAVDTLTPGQGYPLPPIGSWNSASGLAPLRHFC